MTDSTDMSPMNFPTLGESVLKMRWTTSVICSAWKRGFNKMRLLKQIKTSAWNIFTRIGKGPFEFEAEYMSGTADTISGDHDHDGYSLQGCYTIDRADAGDWELVYRYSTVKAKETKIL